MGYQVELLPQAVKQMKKLDGPVRDRIAGLIERIESLEDPRAIGEVLHGDKLGEYWKYRAGDWRLRALIQDRRLLIELSQIEHRSKAY